MRKHDKKTREDRERNRLLRVAARMQRLQDNNEIMASGDPFALELAAKLARSGETSHRWGHLNGSRATEAKRRFKKNFTPPKSWKNEQMPGLAILDKALLFMSTFKRVGLGFRSLHILMMLAGGNGITIQEAADMVGVTYYAIRHDLTRMEKAGFITIERVDRPGDQSKLIVPQLTKKGASVMRALNRFNVDKLGCYDSLVAMGRQVIPTDIRILQMKDVIDEANNIPLDV